MKRRDLLKLGATLSLAACTTAPARARARVVVIGGGYGGATAAKSIALADPRIEVTLVERANAFVSCPLSNLVIGGTRRIEEVTRAYSGLARHGVHWVKDDARRLDAARRTVTLARGATLSFDRAVVAPGIDFLLDEIDGYRREDVRVLHAWKAGPQTVALRREIEALPDGGIYLLSIPMLPYRCPPAPYERACQVASYFKRAKPRAKVLVLDANQEVTSEAAHFQRAWAELYRGIVEYRPNTEVVGVRPGAVRTDFETVKADVLNVVPPQRAGDVADRAGLVTVNRRWCGVDWRTMESPVARGVHVLGDATFPASAMPKSGHMAYSQAKACAAAIVALLNDRAPEADPVMESTCYSFVSDTEAVHLASVHRYDAARKTMLPVPGAGSHSAAPSEREAAQAWAWAHHIWSDMLD